MEVEEVIGGINGNGKNTLSFFLKDHLKNGRLLSQVELKRDSMMQ